MHPSDMSTTSYECCIQYSKQSEIVLLQCGVLLYPLNFITSFTCIHPICLRPRTSTVYNKQSEIVLLQCGVLLYPLRFFCLCHQVQPPRTYPPSTSAFNKQYVLQSSGWEQLYDNTSRWLVFWHSSVTEGHADALLSTLYNRWLVKGIARYHGSPRPHQQLLYQVSILIIVGWKSGRTLSVLIPGIGLMWRQHTSYYTDGSSLPTWKWTQQQYTHQYSSSTRMNTAAVRIYRYDTSNMDVCSASHVITCSLCWSSKFEIWNLKSAQASTFRCESFDVLGRLLYCRSSPSSRSSITRIVL